MSQGELSTGANPFTSVQLRAPHYDWMTSVTPNVKLSHSNSHPNISQKPTNPVFFSFLYQHWKRQQRSSPSKFMRMMLMSVSSILMTLQINWVLNEVPLSVWSFFFLSRLVLRRPLPKHSQQPVKASPLHSHTKRAFHSEFWINVLVRCFCLSGAKPFQGSVESSWTVGASVERMRGLLHVQPHDCAFQTHAN